MKRNLFCMLLLFSLWGVAQRANDCVDAILVCGNSQIASNARGFGVQELDNLSNPCSFQEVNSLWLQLFIATSGTLAFDIIPDSNNITVDYDFYIYGPDFDCNSFTDPIRCSTTNPVNAGLDYNTTGLSDEESGNYEGPGADGNSFISSLEVEAGETYYLLIDRPHGSGGFILNWKGTAQFLPSPEVQKPSDIRICTSRAFNEVDLTTHEIEITESAGVQIDYFNSLANAFDFQNGIDHPQNYIFEGRREDIYVRVSNPNGCFEITDFSIIPSNKAIFVDILIEEFSTDNSVEVVVTGDGDYEYSLTGESYQESTIFRNVNAGSHTILVRDKNGCGISQKDISVIGYPKFFSPNADGKNDIWRLIGASNTDAVKTISIFDRYGKLLHAFGPDGSGWDGMYEGTPLPASDYWFRITLADGKDFKGHFSLKR